MKIFLLDTDIIENKNHDGKTFKDVLCSCLLEDNTVDWMPHENIQELGDKFDRKWLTKLKTINCNILIVHYSDIAKDGNEEKLVEYINTNTSVELVALITGGSCSPLILENKKIKSLTINNLNEKKINQLSYVLGKTNKINIEILTHIFCNLIISDELSFIVHSFNNRFAALRIDYQTLKENRDNNIIEDQIYNALFFGQGGYLIAPREDKKTAVKYIEGLEKDHGSIFDSVFTRIKDKIKKGRGATVSEVFDRIIKDAKKETLSADVEMLVDIVNCIDEELRKAREKEIKNAQ